MKTYWNYAGTNEVVNNMRDLKEKRVPRHGWLDDNRLHTTIKAEAVINELYDTFDEIEACTPKKPQSPFHVYNDTPHSHPRLVSRQKLEKAYSRLDTAQRILNISQDALMRFIRIYRRFMKQTQWQKCLSADDSDRLFCFMIAQYPR
jgi:hypothetical protein